MDRSIHGRKYNGAGDLGVRIKKANVGRKISDLRSKIFAGLRLNQLLYIPVGKCLFDCFLVCSVLSIEIKSDL